MEVINISVCCPFYHQMDMGVSNEAEEEQNTERVPNTDAACRCYPRHRPLNRDCSWGSGVVPSSWSIIRLFTSLRDSGTDEWTRWPRIIITHGMCLGYVIPLEFQIMRLVVLIMMTTFNYYYGRMGHRWAHMRYQPPSPPFPGLEVRNGKTWDHILGFNNAQSNYYVHDSII